MLRSPRQDRDGGAGAEPGTVHTQREVRTQVLWTSRLLLLLLSVYVCVQTVFVTSISLAMQV